MEVLITTEIVCGTDCARGVKWTGTGKLHGQEEKMRAGNVFIECLVSNSLASKLGGWPREYF